MNCILLSIIIPVYNVEQYIAQCLDSVYRQDLTEGEYEVICVDDCSPDNSMSIIDTYATQHKNLIVVKNKINRKLGGARNAGLAVASGKYVFFIDSDDFIADNVLKGLCSEAEKNNLDVLHFDHNIFPESIKFNKVPDTDVVSGTDLFFDNHFIWYEDLVTVWRKIYKREFLEQNNITFAEHIMFEDNDYAFLVFANASRTKHLKKDVYFYRNNPNSITRIQYSHMHICYWLDLCHRLLNIKDRFLLDQKDPRFQAVLGTFIRYQIRNVINAYATLSNNDRKQSRQLIRKSIDSSLKKYVSRLSYLKIRMGIIS